MLLLMKLDFFVIVKLCIVFRCKIVFPSLRRFPITDVFTHVRRVECIIKTQHHLERCIVLFVLQLTVLLMI